jgi:hypothetical protein
VPAGQVAFREVLDLLLDFVAELEPVRTEELDAVVLERIVRGGDHHSEIGPQRPGQHGDRRCRHRAEKEDIHADGGEAGNKCVFQHVSGQARILADHDPVPVTARPAAMPTFRAISAVMGYLFA